MTFATCLALSFLWFRSYFFALNRFQAVLPPRYMYVALAIGKTPKHVDVREKYKYEIRDLLTSYLQWSGSSVVSRHRTQVNLPPR